MKDLYFVQALRNSLVQHSRIVLMELVGNQLTTSILKHILNTLIRRKCGDGSLYRTRDSYRHI